MRSLIISMVIAVCGLYAEAHGDSEGRVVIEPEIQGHFQAGVFEYSFQLVDTDLKKVIKDTDLQLSHTKKLHFIAYDPSLNEFTHVHPEFDGKVWKVSLDLPVNGKYFLWAQGQLTDNTEFSAMTRALVVGGKPENPLMPLGDLRKGTDAQTTVELSPSKITAGKMAMISFKVTREDGQTPVMKPYLGAFAHVIATPEDGDELLHVHPMENSVPNTGMLHATFPRAGGYRIWIQFIEHDELKTVPLSVIVVK